MKNNLRRVVAKCWVCREDVILDLPILERAFFSVECGFCGYRFCIETEINVKCHYYKITKHHKDDS